ncbi:MULTISPECIES: hypothetical protein [Vibrio]|uniref:Uncharacterized protein n=1 Tax=Vibrio mytili TaxID=50718 RepID=A0A0C3I4E3_9VIBR|nr:MULTISPECIES: hypothetical protein [Vibrio]KIN09910.1 hypothetical protein SU60_16315 [Vibrio mytili]MDW2063117.1 hypothetical protein [Vibrio sp. 1579]
MAAYCGQMQSAQWARREFHRRFVEIIPYQKPTVGVETWFALDARVESASDSELNNRGLSELI